jgi:uncharacterized protein (TIGR00251 family)
MFQQINEGVVIKVKVIPKASRSELVGWENDELKIRVAAVPDKGQANIELIRFLAEFLGIGKSYLTMIQGAASRHKRVCISGLGMDKIAEKIAVGLSNES